MVEPGKLFDQILQIKGLYVFATAESLNKFLVDLENKNRICGLSSGEKSNIHYYFLLQGIGMLCERIHIEGLDNERKRNAITHYEYALKHISGKAGKFLIEMLRFSSRLRLIKIEQEYDKVSGIFEEMMSCTRKMIDNIGEETDNWMLEKLRPAKSIVANGDGTLELVDYLIGLYKFQRW